MEQKNDSEMETHVTRPSFICQIRKSLIVITSIPSSVHRLTDAFRMRWDASSLYSGPCLDFLIERMRTKLTILEQPARQPVYPKNTADVSPAVNTEIRFSLCLVPTESNVNASNSTNAPFVKVTVLPFIVAYLLNWCVRNVC